MTSAHRHPWSATSISASCRTCCPRWRPRSSTSVAAATVCCTPVSELGGRGSRWCQPQDRTGPQARRLRRSAGPLRIPSATGCASHPQVSLAGRYLVCNAGCVVDGIGRKAARHRTPAARKSQRSCACRCRCDHIRTASRRQKDIRSDVERLQQRWTRESKAKAAEITAKKGRGGRRALRNPTCWSRSSATSSTKTSQGSSSPAAGLGTPSTPT